jgi:hypothetical protein
MRLKQTSMPYVNEAVFTPRQAIAFVAVFALAALVLPVGVRAATGQIVNLVDPVYSTSRARVHSNGAVRNVLTDPVLGSYASVDGSSLRVGVPLPKTPLKRFATLSSTSSTGLFGTTTFAAGQVAGISSVTVTNAGTVAGRLRVDYLNGLAGSCPSSVQTAAIILDVKVAVDQTVQLDFPQPLTHVYGAKWCFTMALYTAPAGSQLSVTAVGFSN